MKTYDRVDKVRVCDDGRVLVTLANGAVLSGVLTNGLSGENRDGQETTACRVILRRNNTFVKNFDNSDKVFPDRNKAHEQMRAAGWGYDEYFVVSATEGDNAITSRK